MYIGLFLYAGWLIRVAADYLDKNMAYSLKSEEGRKNIKLAFLALIVTTLFYIINVIVQFEDNFVNDYSKAAFFLLLVFFGYMPAHVFSKLMSFFQRKTDSQLEDKTKF